MKRSVMSPIDRVDEHKEIYSQLQELIAKSENLLYTIERDRDVSENGNPPSEAEGKERKTEMKVFDHC